MKIAFRLECAHCGWGFPWHDSYVNQGWVELICHHCAEKFFAKITIPTVDIKISKEHTGQPSAPKDTLESKFPQVFLADPLEGLDQEYDPNGEPAENFIPDEQKEEWRQRLRDIEEGQSG